MQDENKEIMIADPNNDMQVGIRIANVLTKMVENAGLARSFGGQKKHLDVEAWQFLGKANGMTARTVWTKPVYHEEKIIGYDAYVEIIQNGVVIGGAENSCNRDEKTWANKPAYQLKSMAQTRAMGKAFRSLLAWIVALSGYSTTPAEEMSKDDIVDVSETEQPKKTKEEKVKIIADRIFEMAGESEETAKDMLETISAYEFKDKETGQMKQVSGYTSFKELAAKGSAKRINTIYGKTKIKYEEYIKHTTQQQFPENDM